MLQCSRAGYPLTRIDEGPWIMADEINNTADQAAEKAYAAAAEKVAAPTAEAQPATTKPAAAKIAAKVAEVKAAPAKAVKAPAKAKADKAPAKGKPAAKVDPVTKTAAKAKPAKAATKAKPAIKTTSILPAFAKIKETAMTKTTDMTANFQSAFADAQEKAKAAYEKSTAAFGEYNEFAKGNTEALVEAGKILAAGLKEMGEALVADSKGAYEVLVADAKELATVKSPADLYKLQGEMMKKHFDQVVAFGSKQSEAVLKLVGEVTTPVSSRISLAMEKFKAAA
jgi:hypothetical protein